MVTTPTSTASTILTTPSKEPTPAENTTMEIIESTSWNPTTEESTTGQEHIKPITLTPTTRKFVD